MDRPFHASRMAPSATRSATRRAPSVLLEAVSVTFRRPVDDREDQTIALVKMTAAMPQAHDVADGVRIVEIDADANLPNLYRDTRRIHVLQGVL